MYFLRMAKCFGLEVLDFGHLVAAADVFAFCSRALFVSRLKLCICRGIVVGLSDLRLLFSGIGVAQGQHFIFFHPGTFRDSDMLGMMFLISFGFWLEGWSAVLWGSVGWGNI